MRCAMKPPTPDRASAIAGTIALVAGGFWCLQSIDWVPAPGYAGVHVPRAGQYLAMGLAYLVCLVSYGWWQVRRSRAPAAHDTYPRLMLGGALLLSIVSFPTTGDIYTYLQSGVMALAGQDPYVVPTGTVRTAISPFLGWGQTCPYGPIALALFATLGRLVPTSPWGLAVAVYAYKVLCAGLHLGNGWLLRRTLARAGNPHPDRLTIAYLLCPPLLLDHVAQGHVDVLLCLTMIWLAGAMVTGRLIPAAGALMVGALTKTLPIIWAPVLLVEALRRRQARKLVPMTAVALFAAGVATTLALHSAAAWKSLLNPGVGWQSAGSLHNVAAAIVYWLQGTVPPAITPSRVHALLRFGTLAGFALFCAVLLWRRRRSTAPLAGVADMGWLLLVLFLFATPWYQPWYATSLAPLVALTWFSTERYARTFAQVSAAYICSSGVYYLFAIPNGPKLAFFTVSVLTVTPPLAVLAHHLGKRSPGITRRGIPAGVHPQGGL
jgi:alpha-1,6-mannosyltransferase